MIELIPGCSNRDITPIGGEEFWNRYQSEKVLHLAWRTFQYNLPGNAGACAGWPYRILSSYFNAYVHEYQVDQPHDGQNFRQCTLDLMEQWKMMIEPYQ